MKADCRQASVSTKIMSEPRPTDRDNYSTAIDNTVQGAPMIIIKFQIVFVHVFPFLHLLAFGSRMLDETSPAAQGADADDHKGRHAVHDAHFLRDRRFVLNI